MIQQALNCGDWVIQGGKVIGHYHENIQRNCQDAYYFSLVNDTCFGVVSDGCGESQFSEVGSNMIVNYIAKKIRDFILFDEKNPITEIPIELFNNCRAYIRTQLCMTSNDKTLEIENLNNYWLSTISGFIIDKEVTVIFYTRDGFICVNDTLTNLDIGNPPFLGYNCLLHPQEAGMPENLLRSNFEVEIFDSKTVNRLMISTDGFATVNIDKCKRKNNDNPPSLHEQQWNHKGKIALKLWMNQKRNMGYFEDDCAIIVAERKSYNDSQNCC